MNRYLIPTYVNNRPDRRILHQRRHTHHHLQPLTSSRSRDLQVRFVSTSSSSVVSVASSSLSSEVVDTGEIALEDFKTRINAAQS